MVLWGVHAHEVPLWQQIRSLKRTLDILPVNWKLELSVLGICLGIVAVMIWKAV